MREASRCGGDGRLPDRVTIWEVGARDGLQNESVTISGRRQIQFIERLADAGLPVVEVTSLRQA